MNPHLLSLLDSPVQTVAGTRRTLTSCSPTPPAGCWGGTSSQEAAQGACTWWRTVRSCWGTCAWCLPLSSAARGGYIRGFGCWVLGTH